VPSIAEAMYQQHYLQRVLGLMTHPPRDIVRLQHLRDAMTKYPIELLEKTVVAIHGSLAEKVSYSEPSIHENGVHGNSDDDCIHGVDVHKHSHRRAEGDSKNGEVGNGSAQEPEQESASSLSAKEERSPIAPMPSDSVDSLESFLKRPAVLSKKARSAHMAMLESIRNIDIDVKVTEVSVSSSSVSGNHSCDDDVCGKSHGVWCHIRKIFLGPFVTSKITPDRESQSVPRIMSAKQDGPKASIVQRLRSRNKRRTAGVSTCKATERLFYARDPSGASEEDLKSDEEEPEPKHEKDRAFRRRQAGNRASSRGHWESVWVEDDGSYLNPSFCFCLK